MNELFEGSHYELIRTNSEYRMMCMMEDLQLEQVPSWSQPELKETIITTEPVRDFALGRLARIENELQEHFKAHSKKGVRKDVI